MALAAAPAGALLGIPRPAMAQSGAVTPANLELVTLMEDRATFTWYTGYAGSDDGLGRMEPAPGDAELVWGTSPDRLDQTAAGRRADTPYHVVELTGLEPGRTYYYEARSGGLAVPPTAFGMVEGNAVSTDDGMAAATGPYRFTTPMPPPGDFLFSIVLCNDMHMGETVAGLVGSIPGITGISQLPGLAPYPEIMLESLLADTRALGATYLLAAGDISAEAVPIDLTRAKELLERFGTQRADWYATRGNHDRSHDGPQWASCQVGAWGGNDCFRDAFFPGTDPTYFTDDLNGLRIIGLDTYDKPGGGGDAGALSTDQMAWFREQLASDRDRPTVVFGHHPLIVTGSPYGPTKGSVLDATQANMITADYAATPGVFLHHAGHTHRNKRTPLDAAPDVVHQEVAAVKEYPGGFTILRLHTGGYALNFHKSSSDDALAWSERSRMQIAGTWPQFALGSRVADRNHVVERDLSGLSKPSKGAQNVPAVARTDDSGGSTAPYIAGAVGVAALAGGGIAWQRRSSTDPSRADGAPADAAPADIDP